MPQPGRVMEAAGAVLLREQPLRDGHRARERGIGNRPVSSKRRATDCSPEPVDGMDVVACEEAARRAVRPRCGRRRRAAISSSPHLPFPRPFDVRPPTLPRQAEVEEWKKREPIVAFRALAEANRT